MISGARTADQVLVEFLETFESTLNIMQRERNDDQITIEEFGEYHHNLSFTVDDDS